MRDRVPERLLVSVSAISGIYDIALGVALLAAQPWLQAAFSLPAPAPPIHADLNGLFAICVGVGYWLPFRDPVRYRGYLWVMGPLLKGLGSALFVADHVVRHSPDAFLLFAIADGTLAALTFWALRRSAPAGR